VTRFHFDSGQCRSDSIAVVHGVRRADLGPSSTVTGPVSERRGSRLARTDFNLFRRPSPTL
jgi:hypothetical protein